VTSQITFSLEKWYLVRADNFYYFLLSDISQQNIGNSTRTPAIVYHRPKVGQL